MTEQQPLHDPWLVAAWPGLGGVAVIGASYLIRALDAEQVHLIPGDGFFELQQIEVHEGVMSSPRLPRGIFYEWRDPNQRHDLLIFLGEAQPSAGGSRLCREILQYARKRGVHQVVTFAALATQLHPSEASRVHAVATDRDVLEELVGHGAAPLREGQVGGLNGVLIGIGETEGFRGACLMAEMPYFAGGVPNPKAAQAALVVFSAMTGIDLDVGELSSQAEEVDRRLVELLDELKEAGEVEVTEIEAPEESGSAVSEEPSPADREIDRQTLAQIEQLFEEASQDRQRAVELKKLLDRHGVFEQYEDRFLDLFRRAE